MNDSLAKLAESHLASGYDTVYAGEMVDYLPNEVQQTSLANRATFRDSLKQRENMEREY